MARKITVDFTNAIGTFMAKTNLMSDYLGDLDDLDSEFADNFADSNIVSALNHLVSMIDSINDRLFSDSDHWQLRGLKADSADFKRLRVGYMEVDSAIIDSAEIRNLTVDHLTVDSATIRRLEVSEAIIDSAYIDSATIDNAYITNFHFNDSDEVEKELDHMKLLTIKEESGGVVLAGYFMSTTDVAGIP